MPGSPMVMNGDGVVSLVDIGMIPLDDDEEASNQEEKVSEFEP